MLDELISRLRRLRLLLIPKTPSSNASKAKDLASYHQILPEPQATPMGSDTQHHSAIQTSGFIPPSILLGQMNVRAQTEMKKVVGDNATLPCHHQFWQAEATSLDIEWLFQKPNSKQRVVITYFGGRVYDPSENDPSRLAFAGDFLKGDASLLISDLMLMDSGEYSCKVKTGGKYHWGSVNLIVLVKPSKPRCWMEGRLLEGSDAKLSCRSSDGSDPIHYKWERVLDKGRAMGKLPPLALI
ncbi:hypothetical protein GJAV_G00132710, partial [Gymnothorax javanicus]